MVETGTFGRRLDSHISQVVAVIFRCVTTLEYTGINRSVFL